MDYDSFKTSVGRDAPPDSLGKALEALWRLAKGDWEAAHELAQSQNDPVGAWVHAHLHRVEGDQSNAGHWYRKAGKPHSKAPLDAEWDEIVRALL